MRRENKLGEFVRAFKLHMQCNMKYAMRTQY